MKIQNAKSLIEIKIEDATFSFKKLSSIDAHMFFVDINESKLSKKEEVRITSDIVCDNLVSWKGVEFEGDEITDSKELFNALPINISSKLIEEYLKEIAAITYSIDEGGDLKSNAKKRTTTKK